MRDANKQEWHHSKFRGTHSVISYSIEAVNHTCGAYILYGITHIKKNYFI